jgi:hypothetical protein
VFFTSALVGSGQIQAQAALPTGKRAPDTHFIGGCVDPRTGLENVERGEILSLSEFNSHPSAVQFVASPFTDHAISDQITRKYKSDMLCKLSLLGNFLRELSEPNVLSDSTKTSLLTEKSVHQLTITQIHATHIGYTYFIVSLGFGDFAVNMFKVSI